MFRSKSIYNTMAEGGRADLAPMPKHASGSYIGSDTGPFPAMATTYVHAKPVDFTTLSFRWTATDKGASSPWTTPWMLSDLASFKHAWAYLSLSAESVSRCCLYPTSPYVDIWSVDDIRLYNHWTIYPGPSCTLWSSFDETRERLYCCGKAN